jgi:hypothetical protein
MEEACLLAERKLATWRWTVQQPVCRMGENTITMVVMPTLPHQELRILAAFGLDDQAAAMSWLADWNKRHPRPEFGMASK